MIKDIAKTSLVLFVFSVFIVSCNDYYKNDYYDNSPTSGKLKVYHSEGLTLHLKNQAFTFTSQYPDAKVETFAVNENEAVQALLNDSCKAIVINRLLGEREVNAFSQKQLSPQYSRLAKTGVALITNSNTPFKTLSVAQVKQLLSGQLTLTDSLKNNITLQAIIDNKKSDVSFYLLDSVLQQKKFGPNCYALNSNLELIEQVAKNKNSIGFLDFAWLSDVDSDLYKQYKNQIKFISVGITDTAFFEPNQSSFKTGNYPFTRTVYLLRRSDDFSLAKGFEAFMSGPKGQLTFLKQGLLPTRQAERTIKVNMEPAAQ